MKLSDGVFEVDAKGEALWHPLCPFCPEETYPADLFCEECADPVCARCVEKVYRDVSGGWARGSLVRREYLVCPGCACG